MVCELLILKKGSFSLQGLFLLEFHPLQISEVETMFGTLSPKEKELMINNCIMCS